MKNKKILFIIVPVAILIIGIALFFTLSNKKTYTIKFDSNGGSVVETQKVQDGAKVKKPTSPTKAEYVFIEWTSNGKTFDFDTPVKSDLTLVAKWEKENPKEFEVVIDYKNGDTATKVKILEGEELEEPLNPERKGYVFVEWQVNGVAYDFDKEVTEGFTLEAKWLKEYTVTFDSTGGSKVDSQTVLDGEKAIKPTNPEKEDYTFVEWQLNGKAYDFNSKVTSNITLKAKWKEISYTRYNKTAVYTECHIDGTNISTVTMDKGSKIRCKVLFESKAEDKVSWLDYDFKYGKALKLISVENISNATVNNGNYKFKFGTAITKGNVGEFVFEVLDISNSSELYTMIENVKFGTIDNKYYTDALEKRTFVDVWTNLDKHAKHVGSKMIKFDCSDRVYETTRVGQIINCYPLFDMYSEVITHLKFKLEYGNGIRIMEAKLLNSSGIKSIVTDNDLYKMTFDPGLSSLGHQYRITFEVTDISNPNELYIKVSNIKYKSGSLWLYEDDDRIVIE